MFKTLRNNWKKSTFAAAALGYGVYSTTLYLQKSKHMREVCEKIINISEKNGTEPARVLVILNPAANKKKAEKMFKKYCEPYLHLAGYFVEIQKTNYVGHAKKMMQELTTLPDAIVIAGGDGTTLEVVTGLMRREDRRCPPINALPLGLNSKTAFNNSESISKNSVEFVKFVSDKLLSMIEGNVQYRNVMKIEVLDDDKLQPIYGLNRFSWGIFRDIEAIKDKYWYFGNLRHYAAALLNSFSKNLKWNFDTDFTYTPPCAGCRYCIETEKNPSNNFYRGMLFAKKPATEDDIKKQVINSECGRKISGQVSTSQVNITCVRNEENIIDELESKFIESIQPGFTFLKQLTNVPKCDFQSVLTLKSKTIELNPEDLSDKSAFYSIDGEEFDIRAVKVTVVPNAIKTFA